MNKLGCIIISSRGVRRLWLRLEGEDKLEFDEQIRVYYHLIQRCEEIVIETRGGDKSEFDEQIRVYYQIIKRCEETGLIVTIANYDWG